MPATTPIYGFPYPCPGEGVDPTSFAALANAIDAKLLELGADRTAALNRPSTKVTSVTNTAAAGVLKVTTGAGSSIVIPVAGVWMVSAFVDTPGSPGTPNEYRIQVRQNATARFGSTRNLLFYNTNPDTVAHGPMVCAAGDTIDSDFFFTGAGNVDYTVTLDAKLTVRTA